MKYKLTLSNIPPSGGNGIILHYGHKSIHVDGWNFIDSRKTVLFNESEWLGAIKEWHNQLSIIFSKKNKFWWVSHASRLVIWRSYNLFSLKAVLFSLAVIKVYQENQDNIWVLDPDEELISYLLEWAGGEDGLYVDNRIRQQYFRLPSFPATILKKYKNLATEVLRIFREKYLSTDERPPKKSVMIVSMLLNPEIARLTGDHYFGKSLFNWAGSKDECLWVYGDGVTSKSEKIKVLNEQDKDYIFGNNFGTWADVFYSIFDGVRLNKQMTSLLGEVPILEIEGRKLKAFSNNYYSKLIGTQYSCHGIYKYKQFLRLINKIQPKVIFYPYEEHLSERALLLASSAASWKIKTVGYAHAAYSAGHLFTSRSIDEPNLRPDILGVTGEIAKNYFMNSGVPDEQIVIIGSPKHKLKLISNEIDKNSKKKILFICGFGFEFLIFADMVSKNKEFFNNYNLEIRRSFHSWKEEQDLAEKLLKEAGISYLCRGGDLQGQIVEADFIIFEHTTAGIEASLLGKPVFRLALSEALPTTLFHGYIENDHISYSNNFEEISKQLINFENLGDPDRLSYLMMQRSISEKLISPTNLDEVMNILKK